MMYDDTSITVDVSLAMLPCIHASMFLDSVTLTTYRDIAKSAADSFIKRFSFYSARSVYFHSSIGKVGNVKSSQS
jgi:hypothetical protein